MDEGLLAGEWGNPKATSQESLQPVDGVSSPLTSPNLYTLTPFSVSPIFLSSNPEWYPQIHYVSEDNLRFLNLSYAFKGLGLQMYILLCLSF